MTPEFINVLQIFLCSATGAAIIKLIDGVVQWKLKQKEKKDDREEKEKSDLEKKVDNLQCGVMAMMLDRIQYLCKSYIKDGEVDFDDRKRLRLMHTAYHNNGGNGDLDLLMQQVDELPLKKMD